jgi:hypothetical protein
MPRLIMDTTNNIRNRLLLGVHKLLAMEALHWIGMYGHTETLSYPIHM